jgi:glycosyltransferase involved in cell wall biosynthesis
MTSNCKPAMTIVGTYDGDYFVPRRLIPTYQSFGFDVRFLGWDRAKRVPRSRLIGDVEHACIMRGWGYANRKLLIALPLWTLRLAAHVSTLRTDLIHAMDFDAALGVAIGLRIRKVPFLYDIQDNFELRHPFHPLVKRAIRMVDNWIIRRSASTIVVGEERIVGDMALYRSKIIVMPNSPPDLRPRIVVSRDRSHLTLAFVGRIAEPRGVRLVLEACRQLPWLRILMAGEIEGKELGERLRACAQIELYRYLPQEQALELVYRSDASFAFYDPSTEICRRANGAKWYDAMMAGKCLLVNSEVMSAEWIVRCGIGYTSPYADTEKFVRTLRDLYEHREKMEEAGGRARKLYETEFNRNAMDRRLHEAVRKALNGKISVHLR